MGQLREEIRNIILRWNVVTNMWQNVKLPLRKFVFIFSYYLLY